MSGFQIDMRCTTIVFIVLKIANLVDWSWWVVLLPLFINFAVSAIVAILTQKDIK